MRKRQNVALVLDPRFPGGTSSAVAQEIRTLRSVCDLSVVFIESRMFRGRTVNPRLAAAIEDAGIEPVWDPPVVRAQTIVLHNPSFLKFNETLATRFNCAQAILVSHENFLRPNGAPGFDVARCLRLVAERLPPCPRYIAPISPYNRRGVTEWLAGAGPEFAPWRVAHFDWFNICEFDLLTPVSAPRDRRGRVSRPGLEKFPPRADMMAHFPPHAEHCAILGGDSLLLPGEPPPAHWTVMPFGAMDVDAFLATIDFFVYFTNAGWRESFGRVLAEAIAAGKVVITDPGTAEIFGDAVVASDGRDLDALIAGFCADPARYSAFVRAAQDRLSAFHPDRFRETVCGFLPSAELKGAA